MSSQQKKRKRTPVTKNEMLTTRKNGGIPRYSLGRMYGARKIFNIMKAIKAGKIKNDQKKVEKPKKTVEVKTKKYGKKLVDVKIEPKLSKFMETEPIRKRAQSFRKKHNPTRLRPSITPGTILIILAGRFAGKRVVFLKQLPSGLLLVTGPFKLNGVPIRRIDQAYVIATSTKIDISNVKIPESIDDKMFQRVKPKKEKKSEKEFFTKKEQTKEKVVISEERKKLQQEVDEQILAITKGIEHMDHYLSCRFSLDRGQYPHLMKF